MSLFNILRPFENTIFSVLARFHKPMDASFGVSWTRCDDRRNTDPGGNESAATTSVNIRLPIEPRLERPRANLSHGKSFINGSKLTMKDASGSRFNPGQDVVEYLLQDHSRQIVFANQPRPHCSRFVNDNNKVEAQARREFGLSKGKAPVDAKRPSR
jgi:hypothetical protein